MGMGHICSILVGLLLVAAPVQGDLIHHWSFDTDATDAVGGLNGAVQGPTPVPGKVGNGLQFDGTNDSVEFTNFVPPLQGTIVFWMNAGSVGPRGRIFGAVDQFEIYVENGLLANQLLSAGSLPNYINSTTSVVAGTWYHVAMTYDGLSKLQQIYIDGKLDAEGFTADDPWAGGAIAFGHRAGQTSQYYNGLLDDVRYFDEVLDAAKIGRLMTGSTERAVEPLPPDASLDVPRDAILSWTAAEVADTHDVYFGTTFDDVNDAGRAGAPDVLVGRAQSDSTYDPGLLEFGTTYFWRIDEVGAPPASTIYRGPVWSFTTEPYSYPVEGITVTVSSSEAESGPENTINGSGLDESGGHSVTHTDMWLSAADGPQPTWIQYEFDRTYRLHEMWVWNYNVPFESILGFGLKDVAVEYSTDGTDWASLGDVAFAQAPAKNAYAHNTTVDLGGVVARYVRLIVTSGWGTLSQFGLSEVRFFHIPVCAREPLPAAGQGDVDPAAVLTWRPGRDAASHEVYLSTDGQAVADETSVVDVVAESRYDLAALDLELGMNYYWKVNEVNESQAVGLWEGDTWSFSTKAYFVVDDFESYTNDKDAGATIWQTWIDGFDVPENGSQVGYLVGPFAERVIVNSGGQSMPLLYDNTGGSRYSEAERTFDTPQDWTRAGIATLAVYFRGDPNNAPDRLYLKINGEEVTYGGDATDIVASSWIRWTVDLASVGANVERVTTLSIGVDGGGSGTLYVDDIRLMPAIRSAAVALTVGPVESVTATGDDGMILSINGIDVSGLVLGETSADFEKWADHPAADADDFDLGTYASLDDSRIITVQFPVPVTTIFIMERGANDQGLIQPLDIGGNLIGDPQAFANSVWFKPGVQVNNQDAGAMVIHASAPIWGIAILPPADGVTGIDPASIAGLPVP